MGLSPLYEAAWAFASFATTLTLTLVLERALRARGMTVPDYHRPGRPGIPRPGGPAIFVGLVVALACLLPSNYALAGILAFAISFAVGLADDLTKFGGIEKPLLGLLTVVPVIALRAYVPFPVLPFVGRVSIRYLYPLLMLAGFTIYQNAANMLDVYNGLVTGGVIISMLPMVVGAFLLKEAAQGYLGVAFILVLLAFLIRHAYPSKIFPGDSGSFLMGAVFAYYMVISRMEVVGIISSLPMIFNGFFILSSIRGFKEHGTLERPVDVLEDFRITARKGKGLPITLARLVASERPLTQQQIVHRIWALFALTDALAILTLVMMR